MQKRWFIHKDDKPAGPYSAAAVRQLLREGQVDPFDLVSAEGSSVQQELVEVDEIFASENVGYSSKAAGAEGGSAPQEHSAAQRRLSGSSRTNPPGQLIALASDMRRIAPSGNLPVPVKDENAQLIPMPRRKRDPKKYHLIDSKGRVLGPLSPGEIQSLYYRGVVDKNVTVMRDNSSLKVSVAKFVLAYAEAQGVRKTPNQGAHPHIQGVTKSALNRLALARRAQQMREVTGMAPATVAILCSAFLLIVLTVGLLIRDGTIFKGSEPERPRQSRSSVGKKNVATKQPIKKKKPKKAPVRYEKPSVIKGTPGGALGRPGVKKPTRQSATIRQPKKKPPARIAKRPAAIKPQVRPRPPVRPVVQPVIRPIAQPRPLPAPVPAPAPVPKPALPASKAGQTVPTLADGQTVTGLGPMSYNKVAVDICEGACSIVFTGAGGSVTVAFFKNAWGKQLMQKSGKVYISGLVRKNGDSVKILLTGVR